MAKNKVKKKRKSNFSIAFIYFTTIFVFTVALGLSAYFILSQFVFPKYIDKNENLVKGVRYEPLNENSRTILLVGEDDNVLNLLMLFRIEPLKAKISFVPIPISMVSKVNTKETTLKNFYEKDGLNALCSAIENSFGTPIQRYIVLNKDNFNELVSQMGGISYTLPFDLYYENESNGEITNYKSEDAEKVFTGDDLRKIMTYPVRSAGQDFNINISGELIKTLINKNAKSQDKIADNIDNIFNTLSKSSKTNFSDIDFSYAKKDFAYLFTHNKSPATYLVPSGKWNKNATFTLSNDFKNELKAYFNLSS